MCVHFEKGMIQIYESIILSFIHRENVVRDAIKVSEQVYIIVSYTALPERFTLGVFFSNIDKENNVVTAQMIRIFVSKGNKTVVQNNEKRFVLFWSYLYIVQIMTNRLKFRPQGFEILFYPISGSSKSQL